MGLMKEESVAGRVEGVVEARGLRVSRTRSVPVFSA